MRAEFQSSLCDNLLPVSSEPFALASPLQKLKDTNIQNCNSIFVRV